MFSKNYCSNVQVLFNCQYYNGRFVKATRRSSSVSALLHVHKDPFQPLHGCFSAVWRSDSHLKNPMRNFSFFPVSMMPCASILVKRHMPLGTAREHMLMLLTPHYCSLLLFRQICVVLLFLFEHFSTVQCLTFGCSSRQECCGRCESRSCGVCS